MAHPRAVLITIARAGYVVNVRQVDDRRIATATDAAGQTWITRTDDLYTAATELLAQQVGIDLADG